MDDIKGLHNNTMRSKIFYVSPSFLFNSAMQCRVSTQLNADKSHRVGNTFKPHNPTAYQYSLEIYVQNQKVYLQSSFIQSNHAHRHTVHCNRTSSDIVGEFSFSSGDMKVMMVHRKAATATLCCCHKL